MAERDYFDIPDDAPRTPEPLSLPVTPAASAPREESIEIPHERQHGASTNVIAVIVFLMIIAGCVFMILRQMHQQASR